LDQKAGKFELSPLDWAMAGNDSVWTRILQAFVKKLQDEATKAVASLVSEKISNLRVTIEEKQKEGFCSNTDMSKVLH
jgi:formate dehydrogenase maturation protein FdhE